MAASNLPLLHRIAASPARAMAVLLGLHAAVWTALPTLLYPNLPLDLIEALVYGREWQLGYDKLPPLPWWLVQIVFMTVGHDFAYYLLAQLAVVAALSAVFALARPLAGPLGALAAPLERTAAISTSDRAGQSLASFIIRLACDPRDGLGMATARASSRRYFHYT